MNCGAFTQYVAEEWWAEGKIWSMIFRHFYEISCTKQQREPFCRGCEMFHSSLLSHSSPLCKVITVRGVEVVECRCRPSSKEKPEHVVLSNQNKSHFSYMSLTRTNLSFDFVPCIAIETTQSIAVVEWDEFGASLSKANYQFIYDIARTTWCRPRISFLNWDEGPTRVPEIIEINLCNLYFVFLFSMLFTHSATFSRCDKTHSPTVLSRRKKSKRWFSMSNHL